MSDETTNPELKEDEAASEQVEQQLAPDEIVAGLQAELAASRDQTLRALAEAENARKRAERQVAEARIFAIDRFARDLLGVADNLQRAIATITVEVRGTLSDEARSLLEGIELTEKALVTGFERHGLKPINEAGAVFDPNIHEAVAQIPSDKPSGRVAQVFQPGWRLADRTLRPAMVAVSLGQPAPAAAPEPSAEAPSEPHAEPGSIVDRQA